MIVERILVTKQLYPPGGIFVLYSLFILKSVPYQIITKEHFFFNFLFLGSNVFLEYPGSFFHEKKIFQKKNIKLIFQIISLVKFFYILIFVFELFL